MRKRSHGCAPGNTRIPTALRNLISPRTGVGKPHLRSRHESMALRAPAIWGRSKGTSSRSSAGRGMSTSGRGGRCVLSAAAVFATGVNIGEQRDVLGNWPQGRKTVRPEAPAGITATAPRRRRHRCRSRLLLPARRGTARPSACPQLASRSGNRNSDLSLQSMGFPRREN